MDFFSRPFLVILFHFCFKKSILYHSIPGTCIYFVLCGEFNRGETP
jgi:hypothetical protein